MVTLFNEIADNPDCRVVVMSGVGKMFTAGWYSYYAVIYDNKAGRQVFCSC